VNIRWSFKHACKKAGIEGFRFHDLRHTCASLMLLQGVSPKVISETLGHSSVAFTMDVYSHIISGMQENAMALLDALSAKIPTGRRRWAAAASTTTAGTRTCPPGIPWSRGSRPWRST
jgi:hypothetical protein